MPLAGLFASASEAPSRTRQRRRLADGFPSHADRLFGMLTRLRREYAAYMAIRAYPTKKSQLPASRVVVPGARSTIRDVPQLTVYIQSDQRIPAFQQPPGTGSRKLESR